MWLTHPLEYLVGVSEEVYSHMIRQFLQIHKPFHYFTSKLKLTSELHSDIDSGLKFDGVFFGIYRNVQFEKDRNNTHQIIAYNHNVLYELPFTGWSLDTNIWQSVQTKFTSKISNQLCKTVPVSLLNEALFSCKNAFLSLLPSILYAHGFHQPSPSLW